MLPSLGRLRCVVGTDSTFLLRVLKFLDAPNRMPFNCAYRSSMAALLSFHPYSIQATTSFHLHLFKNPITNPCISCEARRLLCTAKAKPDLPPPENDEKLERAKEAVQKEGKEAKPTGLFAKLKYYLKRYWYIAIPIHLVNCAVWFVVLYIAVKSGLDVVALLEKCHIPNYLIDKVKSIPPNAGVAVVAFLLYKIASPLRYATTLLLIQLSFPVLRRLGIMTAKEVKYKMRLKYTNKMRKIKRRYQQKFNRMGPLESKRRQSIGGAKKS